MVELKNEYSNRNVSFELWEQIIYKFLKKIHNYENTRFINKRNNNTAYVYKLERTNLQPQFVLVLIDYVTIFLPLFTQ